MKNKTANLADLANRVIETQVETAKKAEKKSIRTAIKAGFNADCDAIAQ